MTRPVKRKLFKLALVLVAISGGAIINVAVAWGCGLGTHSRGYEGQYELHDDEIWYVRLQMHRGSLRRTFMSRAYEEKFGTSWAQVPRPTVETAPSFSQFHEMAVGRQAGDEFEQINGWPMLSMKGFGVVKYTPKADNHIMSVVGGGLWFVNPSKQPGAETYRIGGILPLRPIWPGFAINTIFYAAIVWMLFAVPRAVRRRVRIKRGLCPACAYPVGVSLTCTECGATVQRAMIAFSPQRGAGM